MWRQPMEGKGAFYAPTVLSGVTEGMPAFDEETFWAGGGDYPG